MPPCSRPQRIVCLTEETVETLYLLGEERRIVGVSGYAVRPPRVRREKPRVSAFISADVPKILALEPDLVLTFSDLQADIAAELIRQRRRGARLQPARRRRHPRDDPHARRAGRRRRQGRGAGAARWSSGSRRRGERAARLPRRPRVYFEEWDEPMISGIGWVSELVEAAGGIDVFKALAGAEERQGPHRHAPTQVIAAQPDIVDRLLVRQEIRAGESSPRGPASTRSRRCATASCARSSRR